MKFIDLILNFFTGNRSKLQQSGIVGICFFDEKISVVYLVFDKIQQKVRLKFILSEQANNWYEREEALKKIVLDKKLLNQKCVCVLKKGDYKLTMIETPDFKDGQKGKVFKSDIEDYVDYDIDDKSVDMFRIPMTRSSDGKDVSFLVSMENALMIKIEKCVLNSGLSLEFIDIPEFSYRNILKLLYENMEKGYLLLDLRSDFGYLYIYYDDSLLMSRKISRKVGIDVSLFKSLQNSKVTKEKYDENLENLSFYIQRSINYCKSVFRSAPVSNIFYFSSEDIDVQNIKEHIDKDINIRSKILDFKELPCIFENEEDKVIVNDNCEVISVALRDIKNVEDKKSLNHKSVLNDNIME